MDRRILPFLVLLGCQHAERDLDKSVIQGTLVIPPTAITEDESRQHDNDSAGLAFGVGPEGATSLTYRAVVLDGETDSFTPSAPGAEFGDADWFVFSPIADGTFSLDFSVPGGMAGPMAADTDTTTDTTSTTTTDTTDTTTTDTTDTTTTDSGGTDTTPTDTGGTDTTGTDSGTTDGTDSGTTATTDSGTTGTPGFTDAIVYSIRVYDMSLYDAADPSAGLVAEGFTDGNAGSWSGSFDVVGGGDYAVEIGGVQNTTTQDPVPWHLVFSGSAPAEDAVLVGAYLEGDPAVASNPAGGAAAGLWTFDPTTLTWTGFYSIEYIRTVTNPPEDTSGDTGALPVNPTIDEAVKSVFLTAGTLQSLNKSPSAGSLYSSVSVEVPVPGERVILPDVLVLDAVFPKVIGQTVTEVEPDTTNAELNLADYTLVLETLVAQDLGMLSGLGYVDIVDGSSDMSSGASGWNGDNDSDAFAFTVPEPMYVSMVASWADSASDIDFGIWGNYEPYGTIDYFSSFSDSYCLTGADPEVCTTIVPLEPEVTYYLVALGYLGDDVEPYHIELEWIAP